ncbi:hypothetical protein [Pseudalkalibacillus salsuginis]|uniref:hypothetical protein n=1 Tax=Pseudalkalibacillus salsuginis TaxID=2910972 RepID=UPI001F2AFB82|nr:hypothetical protein [Pseudalkalibacillus salsuginis]MCF6408983.1 hypothetical protein [Pseudalkalibacillus salsuginis]
MGQEPKKKPLENGSDKVSIRSGLESDCPLDPEERFHGDSVDEHKEFESSNEYFAEKEISQTFNNS